MGAVRKADFYFGAMLSCLINEGWAPVIIERGDSSRVYSITTDFGDCQIYAKYKSNSSKSQDTQLWHFQFTPDEIRKIGILRKENKNLFIGLICGQEELQDSEVVMLTYKVAADCLGLGNKRDSWRISVKRFRGGRRLRVYGTGREDTVHGRENAWRIPRDLRACFQEETR